MNDTYLSQRLAKFVSSDFFRPLTRPSTPIYVDCADRLVTEAGEAGRLPQADAIAIVREVLQAHPQVTLADEEGGGLQDVRARAGKMFNQLLTVGWVEEQPISLHERWVVVSPGLRPLLRMLRDLAEDDVAELKSFADTLRGVCATLEERRILDPLGQSAGELRASVHDLLDRMDLAIDQLHGVEKLVHGFERRQRETVSGAETLHLFYHEFHEGQHMVCYDALRGGGLLPRLQRARNRVRDAADEPAIIQHLADGICEQRHLEPTDAWNLATDQFRRLEKQLGGLRARAEAIDARMAAFNRLSVQRYRYQSELRGRRPEMIRQYCEAMNAAHRGSKFSELRVKPDFDLQVPELECFYGSASLARPRRGRVPVALELSDGRSAEDEAMDLERLKQRQRFALTPHRAARLVARLMRAAQADTDVDTGAFHVETPEELLDLMAVAAYSHGIDAGHGREMHWRVASTSREDQKGLHPEDIQRDAQGGWTVERFALIKSK